MGNNLEVDLVKIHTQEMVDRRIVLSLRHEVIAPLLF